MVGVDCFKEFSIFGVHAIGRQRAGFAISLCVCVFNSGLFQFVLFVLNLCFRVFLIDDWGFWFGFAFGSQ